jgi:hypothetical protein
MEFVIWTLFVLVMGLCSGWGMMAAAVALYARA